MAATWRPLPRTRWFARFEYDTTWQAGVTVGFAIIMALVIGAIGKRRGWTTGQMLAVGLIIVVPSDVAIGYNWHALAGL